MKTVPLYGQKAAGRVALVDDADYALVMQHRWQVQERPGHSGPYAKTSLRLATGHKTSLMMHKLITGWPQTDHQDHDGLNNQRYNLRPATHSQNVANSRKRGGSSAYKGVTWHKSGQRWQAQIRVHRERRYLGIFKTEEEAARAYDAAARAAFGEFAYLNFP